MYGVVVEIQQRQLHPRGDPKLPEHVAQMEVDRPWTQEELRGHFAIVETARDVASDLKLLRRQIVRTARLSPARSLPTGAELTRRPFGPKGGAEGLEAVERRTQVLAGVDAPAGATEELAERELGPRPLERAHGRPMELERRLEKALGVGCVVGQQRPAMVGDGARPRLAGVSSQLLERCQAGHGELDVTDPDRGFDSVEGRPEHHRLHSELAGMDDCGVGPTGRELEVDQRPAGCVVDVGQAEFGSELATLVSERVAAWLVSAQRCHKRPYGEDVANHLMLSGVAGEFERLEESGVGGTPMSGGDLAQRESGNRLRQQGERSVRTRRVHQPVVDALGLGVGAEEQPGATREDGQAAVARRPDGVRRSTKSRASPSLDAADSNDPPK